MKNGSAFVRFRNSLQNLTFRHHFNQNVSTTTFKDLFSDTVQPVSLVDAFHPDDPFHHCTLATRRGYEDNVFYVFQRQPFQMVFVCRMYDIRYWHIMLYINGTKKTAPFIKIWIIVSKQSLQPECGRTRGQSLSFQGEFPSSWLYYRDII